MRLCCFSGYNAELKIIVYFYEKFILWMSDVLDFNKIMNITMINSGVLSESLIFIVEYNRMIVSRWFENRRTTGFGGNEFLIAEHADCI